MKLLEIGPGKDLLPSIDGVEWDTIQRPGQDRYHEGSITHDIENIPWPIESETYDRIYSSHVIEHITWDKTVDVLRELKRVLKPGGYVEIWCPDFAVIVDAYLKKQQADRWRVRGHKGHFMKWINARIFAFSDSTYHKACFDFEYLKMCLIDAGFQTVKRNKKLPRGKNHGIINLGVTAW